MLSEKAIKIFEYMKNEYINSGYIHSGCICYNEAIVNELKLTTKEFNELINNDLVQKRDCDAYAYELTIPERKKLIINNNLSKVWEEKAPYFYPNNKYGEVTQVLNSK